MNADASKVRIYFPDGHVELYQDRVPHAVREWLFALDPKQYRLIAAAKSILVPRQVATVYITGIKLSSLPKFLRSLNVENSRALLDRAQSYIERTLTASRLPKNPFTISIMLQECQHGGSKFSTPTMGRLIERFVELQLGSHSEAQRPHRPRHQAGCLVDASAHASNSDSGEANPERQGVAPRH